jgi:cysteine-rich repeat protein
VLPRCGDGIVDTALGEVCDDGNSVFGDGCRPDCKSTEVCGNGIVDPEVNEQCDDGNSIGRDGCSACKLESAIVLTPGATPHKRDSQAIAYDGARQRTVMYGGWTVDGNLNDTWEWDGASWTQITTAHSPGPRLDASMAYDAVRHRVVLFGGYGANYTGFKSDTWEYDGVDWTLKAPTASPPTLAAAAMSFDANRGHLLLYGGRSSDATQGTATWDYDGTTWTKLSPAANPGVREGARMAYDAKNNNVVLVGGGDNHTWTWSGSAWTDRGAQAVFTSTGYDEVALAFDSNRQVIVAWDGNPTNTFEWHGTNWASIAGVPTAPGGSTYSFLLFAYDTIRKQMLLFGGFGLVTGATTDDYNLTWVRTGTAWAQPAALAEPSARYRSGAAYDPIRKRVVLFGGEDQSLADLNDTWEWNGSKWTVATPTAKPPVREGMMLDYDNKTRTVMEFGGNTVGVTATQYADLWSYNGATWSQPAQSTGRVGLNDSGMAYDAAADLLVTYGGRSTSVLDTTWTWDATTGWSQQSPATKPPAREDFGIAYDPARNRTVLFGGQDDSGTLVSDVWEWNGSTWNDVSPLAGPDARIGLELLYNPDAQCVMAFGNSDSLAGEDLWEWNGARWNQRQVVGTIKPRYREAVAYDRAHHELVVFAGQDNLGNTTQQTQRLAYWPNRTVEACTSAALDYDNDGKAGCADEECWAVCTPLCPPGTPCPPGLPRCGDGTCTANEDCNICPADCGACAGKCGDFHCDSGETHANCPNDC